MPIKSSLIALFAFTAACSSNAPTADAPSPVEQAPDVSVASASFDAPHDDGVAMAGCAPTMFVAGDRCYRTSEAACAAQGCDSCVDLETAPVQVRCWD